MATSPAWLAVSEIAAAKGLLLHDIVQQLYSAKLDVSLGYEIATTLMTLNLERVPTALELKKHAPEVVSFMAPLYECIRTRHGNTPCEDVSVPVDRYDYAVVRAELLPAAAAFFKTIGLLNYTIHEPKPKPETETETELNSL